MTQSALTQSVDDLLDASRARINRVGPHELDDVIAGGGLVIDIRPAHQRSEEGRLPGALVVERNVLEWRLDPSSPDRLAAVRDHSQQVVLVCSEGYASSLAAASLVDLGFDKAGDLRGGYKAWVAWTSSRPGNTSQPEPTG